jgi:uncharacterized membrane protein YkoI
MNGISKKLSAGGVALGVALGSYGIASAATGSTTTSSSATPSTAPTAPSAPQAAPQGWGAQRSDETLLTGDTAAKVKEIALAKEPGASVVRVETDADGHATYEAHVIKSDGTLATVYVDKDLNFVSVESR